MAFCNIRECVLLVVVSLLTCFGCDTVSQGVTHVICCTGTTAFPSKRWDGDNTPERVGEIIYLNSLATRLMFSLRNIF